jgi:hypothetical protein
LGQRSAAGRANFSAEIAVIDLAKILHGFAAAQLRFLQMQEGHRTDPATQGNSAMSNQEKLKTENLPTAQTEERTMSTDLMKVSDGFEGFEPGVEGDDRPQAGGVVQGVLAKFTNEAKWVTRDGDELPADLELVAVDIARVAQKWVDQVPTETIILAPGQKFPDVKKLNDEVPRSEWREGPSGDLVGPWQTQHIVYLLDPKTMERFTYPTGTIGGSIAVRDLADRTTWMRRFRGTHVYPMVTLGDAHMNTKFGGRQRPQFKIVRWVSLGSEGKVLPAPAAEKPSTQGELPTVEAPSLSEEMGGDKVKF